MPWPVSRNVLAGLRAGGDGQQDAALERRDGHLGAQQRLLEGEQELALEIRALRVKTGCARSFTVTTRSRPPGPLPDSFTRLPVSTPAGIFTS